MIRVKIKKIQPVNKCRRCLYKMAVDDFLNYEINVAILEGDMDKVVELADTMRLLKEDEDAMRND